MSQCENDCRTGHWFQWKSSSITPENDNFNANNPLYNKTCVITGALEKFVRKDAMQIIANLGGINADSVTKKTDFLILGNNDLCKLIKDGKSSKQKKAEELILKGFQATRSSGLSRADSGFQSTKKIAPT